MLTNQITLDRDLADSLAPVSRLSALLDDNSLHPLHENDGSGALAVRGSIDGANVVAYCTDARMSAGAMTARGCAHIADAIDMAAQWGWPVIGLLHSAGASLGGGAAALDGVGRMFAAMIRASGRVPQISVVLGPAAGGAAYGPALTDIVIMSAAAKVFVTGPAVVQEVTGEQIDMAALGGPEAHSRKSGVTHLVADSEAGALALARKLTGFFTRPGICLPESAGPAQDLGALLPASPRRAYDIRAVVRKLLDPDDGFTELQPRWAANVVVGLGRLCGRTVGVVANNPLRMAGCLDALSAEKAARFVRMCDAFRIPLLVLVDVPGYLPGVSQEWDGIVRRGAKLLHAFAEAVVPRLTLILRKSYGGAYIAMNSRSLGATRVFAWPDAEIAVMGPQAAVRILHRRKLAAVPGDQRAALEEQLVGEHQRQAGGTRQAAALGLVDEVIDPAYTRHTLATALAAVPAARGIHRNIPL